MKSLGWLAGAALAVAYFCFGPAQADCLSSCLGSGCSGVNYDKDMYCKLRSNDCVRQCRESGSGASGGSRDRWGAIAYSDKTGNYGLSYGYARLSEARRSALAECKASDCDVMAWFSNSCGAVAAGEDDVSFGAQNNSRSAAERLAVAGCVRLGGGTCKLVVSRCSP
jgi:hypothetical protein